MTEGAESVPPDTEHRRGSVRSRLTSRSFTFGCLLLGGLLAIVGSAQPWWRAVGGDAQVAFKGTEATGGLSQALAVVTLAGTLLVLVLRSRGRRVVAVALAATGLGVVVAGALRLRPTGDAVRTRMREVSLIDQYALTATPWPWVFAAGGALVVLGAVALLFGAPTWAVTATRFERDTPEPTESVADPSGIWKAQDAGLDPTDLHPDVHEGRTGDTMVTDSHCDSEIPSPHRGRGQPESGPQGRTPSPG